MFGSDLSEAWLDYADRAYVSARILWCSGLMLDAPVQCHRAIELYLKAYLVANGRRVKMGEVWGHNLDELREHAAKIDQSFAEPELSKRVAYFQRYFDSVRYPTDIEGRIEDGSGMWFAFDANILPLDQIVAYLRARVPRRRNGMDLLLDLSRRESEASQVRALKEDNPYVDLIVSDQPTDQAACFDSEFTYHLRGC